MASISRRRGGGRIKNGKICRRKKREFGAEFLSPKLRGKMAAIVGQNKTWMLLVLIVMERGMNLRETSMTVACYWRPNKNFSLSPAWFFPI